MATDISIAVDVSKLKKVKGRHCFEVLRLQSIRETVSVHIESDDDAVGVSARIVTIFRMYIGYKATCDSFRASILTMRLYGRDELALTRCCWKSA